MFTFPSLSDLIKCHYRILLLFSHPVKSNSWQPHGLQHARTPCPSPPPGVSLPKFMFIASVLMSSHLILWFPLLLLPSIFPIIRVFSNVLIRWPKYWSFNFSISPSSEYSGLMSLQSDWFNLFAVQGTFKSLLQHHSLKASILWCSASFTVQLSQPYVTTGKTIALTVLTFKLPHSQFLKPNS